MQILSQLRTLWQKQPTGRRSSAVVALLAVLGIVAYSTLLQRPAAWSSVAENASPDDAQELFATLQARGITARLRDGKVEVLAAKLDEARAITSAAGLPRTGKGYELFDKSSLGQSSFTEQINYRRALQVELARSITAMGQVEGARVHLAMGKRSVFKDRDEPATASVALRLHPGQTLSAEQVRGIRQLIAASVDGMKAEAVVVVDNHGNLLDATEPGASDRKAEIERTVTTRVRAMLERVLGAGKVSVVTSANVDTSQISESQEVYDPTPVLRSESRSVEGIDAAATSGGVAGTRGNLPGAPAATTTPGIGSNQRLQETKNYELGRTLRQITKPGVQLQRLHLAIVVDHKAGADGKPVPRTEQELAELKALARQAAGIDDARGDQIEIRSIPFAPDPEQLALETPVAAAPATLPLVPIAIGAGGAFVALVLLALVLRARGRRKQALTTPQLALPVPVGELERALSRRPIELGDAPGPAPAALPEGRNVRERVLDAVRNDVERTASVLSSWLAAPPVTASGKEIKP
jgi:flagellar M-ring protein FliF